MKICFVSLRGPTNAKRRGGSQDYILSIASSWIQSGHDVWILCGQERVKGVLLPEEELVSQVLVRRVGSPRHRALPIIRAATAAAPSVDIVIENIMSFPFMLPIWFNAGANLVALKHHFEGVNFIRGKGIAKGSCGLFLEEFVQPLIYRNIPFVTVSTKTDQVLRNKWIKPKAPLTVIPPGISDVYRKTQAKTTKAKDPTIAYLGALDIGRKKVDHLIYAFKRVSTQVSGAKLIIAGQGPDRDRLEKAARGLLVEFKGFVSENEKQEILASAWVFASPSLSEGFGITWIEANAQGLPVIGYDLGLDTVNSSCARMVRPGDVDALAEALVEVLSDAALRDEMEKAAHENASRFSWARSSKRFMEFIQKFV